MKIIVLGETRCKPPVSTSTQIQQIDFFRWTPQPTSFIHSVTSSRLLAVHPSRERIEIGCHFSRVRAPHPDRGCPHGSRTHALCSRFLLARCGWELLNLRQRRRKFAEMLPATGFGDSRHASRVTRLTSGNPGNTRTTFHFLAQNDRLGNFSHRLTLLAALLLQGQVGLFFG